MLSRSFFISVSLFEGEFKMLDFLCPGCRQSSLIETNDSRLVCNNCGEKYSIENQIARLGTFEDVNDSFGYQWNLFRKTQLDSFSKTSISKDRIYELAKWSDDTSLVGQNILEAGSGSGRFTEVIAKKGGSLYSFDYSRAIDANRENNSQFGNVTFFQGDIFNIPFEDGVFDQVFCVGVIQHTPDPKLAFENLASKVRPGGKLYVDSYRKDFFAMIHWKYLLRPLTKRISFMKLFPFINFLTPKFIPLARLLRKLFGRAGARLVPIVEYSHLGLSKDLNRDWAILDTFDMYSPAHDHPASIFEVRSWFLEFGFEDFRVEKGSNGIIATGVKPL